MYIEEDTEAVDALANDLMNMIKGFPITTIGPALSIVAAKFVAMIEMDSGNGDKAKRVLFAGMNLLCDSALNDAKNGLADELTTGNRERNVH